MFDGEFQYGEIPDENFYIEYGDLEFLQGTFGLEDVSIGGLTAHKQTVALVELAYWFGDDITAGLMGLAYPALTSEFPGTNVSADDYNKTILYNPIITTLWKEHKMAPVFSLALERESNKGLIALGGLPPVIPASAFYSTPIVIVSDVSSWSISVLVLTCSCSRPRSSPSTFSQRSTPSTLSKSRPTSTVLATS